MIISPHLPWNFMYQDETPKHKALAENKLEPLASVKEEVSALQKCSRFQSNVFKM